MPASLLVAAGVTLAAGGGLAYGVHRARSKSPRGKGVFVRSVRHAKSPADLADHCSAWGLDWVAILLVWQKPDRDKLFFFDDLPAVCEQLRRRGIDVWLWAWPEPGRAQGIVDLYRRAEKAVGRCKLRGLILDPERPYYAKRLASQARIDVDKLRELKVPLGCTTYGGGPPHHPSFPWGPWAEGTDFGMPQIYDSKERLGENYPARSIEAWQAAGWNTVIPVWAAYDKTPGQMQEMIDRTPRVYRAVSWWDFYWIVRSQKRAQVVTDFQVPRREGKRVIEGKVA